MALIPPLRRCTFVLSFLGPCVSEGGGAVGKIRDGLVDERLGLAEAEAEERAAPVGRPILVGQSLPQKADPGTPATACVRARSTDQMRSSWMPRSRTSNSRK